MLDKIKKHVDENRTKYIVVGGVAATVTVVSAIVVLSKGERYPYSRVERPELDLDKVEALLSSGAGKVVSATVVEA